MTDFIDPDFPPGMEPDDDFDNDIPDLHVNFTDTEAASKALEPLPTGKYNARIAKVELKRSQSAKNYNKPYYNIQFRVTDGPYKDRIAYTNVMLFEGALYSLNQLMNATGFDTKSGQVRVPRIPELVGKELVIRGIKVPPKGEYDEKFEVKGMMPTKDVAAAVSNSLEP